MNKRDINALVADYLWGDISESDLQRLRMAIQAHPELGGQIESLASGTDLSKRYRDYAETRIPAAGPGRRMPMRNLRVMALRLLPYAAVTILCVFVTALLLRKPDRKEIVRVKLPKEVLVAMEKANRCGKNNATMTIPHGKPIMLDNFDDAREAEQEAGTPDEEYTLTTHHDSEFWLTLDDGTRVHLDYGTSLTYPVKFGDGDRTVVLDGDAYFYVSKDSQRPFYVKTRNGTVKVCGTEFNVSTHREAGQTQVVLVKGSVSMLTTTGREFRLIPGQMGVTHAGSDKAAVQDVDVTPYTAWNEGRFVFSNYPMSKLMDVVSHWYNRRVVFKDAALGQTHFTGTFDRYGDLGAMLRAIEAITDLKVADDGRNVTIYR